MSRYIDADAIISFVDAGHLRNPLELAWSDNDVVDMIESRPTVDAVPVVRCKDCRFYKPWESDGEIYCSVCDYDAPTEGDYRQVKTNYCPNCGAKMTKGELL